MATTLPGPGVSTPRRVPSLDTAPDAKAVVVLGAPVIRMVARTLEPAPTPSLPVGFDSGADALTARGTLARTDAPTPVPVPSPVPTLPVGFDSGVDAVTALGVPTAVTIPTTFFPVPRDAPSLDIETVATPGRPRAMRANRRRERLLSVSTWIRNIGVLLILFAAWQLWGTAIAQHHSQDALGQQFRAELPAPPRPAGTAVLLPAAATLPVPREGSVIALVQIPKIGVSQYVVSGTNANDLAEGPGHYTGTALPGQYGNVAIAGHRTTHGAPFNRLAQLARGDHMYLTDLEGQRLTYVVVATPFAVSPSNVSVLNYFGDNRLTLTTCNPEFSASQRLIVVAGYVGLDSHPAQSLPTEGGTPYKVQIGGEAGWNTSLLPLALVELGLLILLGLTNPRWSTFFGREARWLILVPISAALVYAFFQTMTNVLPAAV